MLPINSIAFVVNAEKKGAAKLAQTLLSQAEAAGVKTKLTDAYPITEGFLEGVEACCVIGGDGTLLSVVEEATKHQVPAFGVNQGKLGFLATYTESQIKKHFEEVLAGKYNIVARPILKCKFVNGKIAYALNDLVIKNEHATKLIPLQVLSNKHLITEYRCDGLIFAAPTGSTAYNLSAGGPIIHPSVRVMVMTPICPHTLTNRSVVVGDQTKITIHCTDSETVAQINLDGRHHQKPGAHLPIELEIAEETFPLLQPKNFSYFNILRNKLKWGKANPLLKKS